jgi:hypothetical protein
MARAAFKPYASVIQGFLEGPVVRADLEARAARVAELARENASGKILQKRSNDLHDGIRYTLDRDSYGLYAIIGTNARNPRDDFQYPAYLDAHGFPWLRTALERGWNDLQYVRAHRRGIVNVRAYTRRRP